jgi:hypothetical protein
MVKIIKRKIVPKQLKGSDIPKIRQWILSKRQNGLCPICGKKITDPCLDHSHKKKIKGTGLIRGVLCRSCNVFLAKSENNCIRYGITIQDLPRILRNMADYFERPHYNYIHPSEKPKDKKLKKSSYNKLIKCLQKANHKKKIPDYPKSGKLTKVLECLYEATNINPEYYGDKND